MPYYFLNAYLFVDLQSIDSSLKWEDDVYIDLMFVVILIRIKMGCGVICGDNTVPEATSQYNNAQHSLSILIPSLNKTSALVHKQSYQSFIQQYRLNPKKFHLIAPRHLTKGQQVSEQILIKWKLILYGLDGDNKKYCKCLGLSQMVQQDIQINLNVQQESSQIKPSIIFHECFVQIQKDLERTFALPEGRKKDFENVLKRIANFFPKMGYTQGINFVIGFLIIIGYSENDSFWMFVHIALNKRYMLLGLYQDDFPLSNAFIYIFKNVLRRTNEALYLHIFDILCVDSSIWIFKWFTTCFIYTFPFELIKYAWQIIIQLGSIGIVTFAIGLTRELGPFLIQKEDMSDVSQFLQSLKSLEQMNHYINMERVMKTAFQIEILQTDLDGVEECAGFYGKYFRESFCDLQRHLIKNGQLLPKFGQMNNKSQEMLDQWYETLQKERLAFQMANRTNITQKLSFPFQQKQIIQKIKEVSEEVVFYNYEQESTAPDNVKIRRGSMQLSRAAGIFRNQKYCCEKINEKMDEQSRSQRESVEIKKSTKQSNKGEIIDISQQQDQLDKFGGEFKNMVKQNVKINNFAVPVSNTAIHRKYNQSVNLDQNRQSNKNKTNKIPLPEREKTRKIGTFALAAQNIIKVDSYDASSVSSKHVSNRSHGKNSMKGNEVSSSQIRSGRSCACKIKTEENKLSNYDRSSELASSKDKFSDKSSIYNRNMSHNEDPLADLQSITMDRIQSNRDRIQTFTDYMINSHGPILKEKQERFVVDEPNQKKIEGEIEVEVLPFKKDKKMVKGKVSQIQICKRQTPKACRREGFQNEEESIETIRPCSFSKISQKNCQKECHNCQGDICDVESVR